MKQQSLDKKASDIAWEFFTAKKEHDQMQKEFDERKKLFYEDMGEYFYKKGCSSAKFSIDKFDGCQLTVKRVAKTSIEWDAVKLEKRIDKSIAKQVIKKQYRISDMYGLIQYLKSCGVDPLIFKKFILVDKTVDEKAVERLGDTGQLTASQISGCYTVKTHNPYFTISDQKGDG